MPNKTLTGSKSANSTPAVERSPTTTSKHKMVLRIKTSRKDEYMEKEAQPTSSKRAKSSFSTKKTIHKKKKKMMMMIDPTKPKKPPTAFFYFLEDFRKGYQQDNPEIKSMRNIGKACGEKWKMMTYEEKVKYYDIATEKRAEFERAMEEYIRRKESGEDLQPEESDSELDGV